MNPDSYVDSENESKIKKIFQVNKCTSLSIHLFLLSQNVFDPLEIHRFTPVDSVEEPEGRKKARNKWKSPVNYRHDDLRGTSLPPSLNGDE